MVFHPLVTFLTKVEAFVGAIPVLSISVKDKKRYLSSNIPTTKSIEDSNGITESTTFNITSKKLVQSEDDLIMLTTDVRNNLKSQSFAKIERIKDVLENSQQLSIQSIPELRDFLKVFLIYFTYTEIEKFYLYLCVCIYP